MVLMGTPPRGASHSRVAPVVKNHTPISNNPGPASNPAALDLLCSDTPEGKTVCLMFQFTKQYVLCSNLPNGMSCVLIYQTVCPMFQLTKQCV